MTVQDRYDLSLQHIEDAALIPLARDCARRLAADVTYVAIFVLMAVSSAVLVGCRSEDAGRAASATSPAAATPAASTQKTPESVAGATSAADVGGDVDLHAFCFDESDLPDTSSLPGTFDSEGYIEVTNQLAATSELNPVASEHNLAGWGRLTGIVQTWVFATETEPPTKGESLTVPTATLDARSTQEAIERRSTAIQVITCEVEIYTSSAGAHQAIAARFKTDEATMVLAPEHVVTLVDEGEPALGDESRSAHVVWTYPDLGPQSVRQYLGLVRRGNLLGQVTVVGGPCGQPESISCTEVDAAVTVEGARLLAVLDERIRLYQVDTGSQSIVPVSTAVPTPAEYENRQLSADNLHRLLPSLYQARMTSGLELKEVRIRQDTSQLFEHTITDDLELGIAGIYEGEKVSLILELALFETIRGADAGFAGIEVEDLVDPFGDFDTIDMGSARDSVSGWVFEPDPGSNDVMAIAVVQVDRVVVGVTLLAQDRSGLAQAARALTELEADAISAWEIMP